MIFWFQMIPHLQSIKVIPKFLLENSCTASLSSKTSGYSFLRDNLDKENRSALYAALDQLPPIQARRVYAHYILGKKKSEIARAENVVESSICDSIRRGVKNLAEILKNFYG